MDPEDKAGRTYAEVIAYAMVRKAARGDVRAAREIRVATEGRAPRRAPGLPVAQSHALGTAERKEQPVRRYSAKLAVWLCRAFWENSTSSSASVWRPSAA